MYSPAAIHQMDSGFFDVSVCRRCWHRHRLLASANPRDSSGVIRLASRIRRGNNRHGCVQRGDQFALPAIDCKCRPLGKADGAAGLDDLSLEFLAFTDGRGDKTDLIFNGQHLAVSRGKAERGIAAGAVHRGGDDPAMYKPLLL